MGADGHIAIYDWEKVQPYLVSRTDKYSPKYKTRQFEIVEFDAAEEFAKSASGHVRGIYQVGGSAYPARRTELDKFKRLEVGYFDASDAEPQYWPGYVCDWTCNGKKACLVYWGDNIIDHPFDDYEWLREWCDANALLVANQEVWT